MKRTVLLLALTLVLLCGCSHGENRPYEPDGPAPAAHEGMLFYVVSPGGSLGQVYADEMNDGRPVLEWVYFALGEGESTLPSEPETL